MSNRNWSRWQAALLIAAAFPAQAQIYSRNLIANGDAEAGPAARTTSDAQVTNVPSWTISGSLSVGTYGGDGFLETGAYGPVNRGKQMFWGGPGNKRSTAVQTVDLSAAAADIDAGKVKYYLSGYMGWLYGSYDTINQISLKLELQDASGADLLTATATGPTEADISVAAGLLPRTASGGVPANTRKAKVTIDLYLPISGNATNYYSADNISLVLTTDPMMGINQLANGNAEMAPEDTDRGRVVPGWNADTDFVAWQYGDDKMPTKTDPGPSDRGKYFFSCPSSHTQCRAYQNIDFSSVAKQVDAGAVTYTLSGWLGGDTNYPDNADLTVQFYDASAKALGSIVRVGPVTQANRSGQRALVYSEAGGQLPTGARSAQVNLYFHKLGPVTDNLDAFADDIVFQLDSMQILTVVNGASSTAGAVAPGEFVAIYGTSLGPAAGLGGMAKGLANVHASFNGIEAYLTYASASQINALVPYGVTGKADVVVKYNGNTSNTFPLPVTTAAPGIFTQQYGAGQIWALNDDYSFNSPTNPVARGGWVAFWATGQGAVSPGGVDGETITNPKNVVLPVQATIGSIALAPSDILFVLLTYTGEAQIAVKIPANAPTGNVPLVITMGSASSRADATIAIK
jgi:uncharacterized protein (TIGR03437 family)